MKTSAILFITLCSILTACMNPLPSDFKGKTTQGLTEDDVLLQWRLSKEVNQQESIDITQEDSLLAQQYVAPFFDQLIPKIFKDFEDKKLNIYEYLDMGQPSEKQFDVQAKIEALNGGKIENPLSSFNSKVHFNIDHLKQSKNLDAEFVDMMIIWHDVAGMKPEKVFGVIKMKDLYELGYTIDMNNKSYPIDEYVREFCANKIYPIRFRTVDNERGLQTLEEAFYLKDKVISGQWNSLSWINLVDYPDELNMSGKEKIALPQDKLTFFEGYYAFPPEDSESDTLFLEIDLKEDYLSHRWSRNPGYSSVLYPAAENEIFSRYGDILTFKDSHGIVFENKGTFRQGIRIEK